MTNRNTITIIFTLVIIAILGGAGFYYFSTQKATEKSPAASSENTLSPTQSTTTPETKTYRNEEWGFEFRYPEGWTLRENVAGYSPFSKFDLIGVPFDKEYLLYHPTPPFLINIIIPDFAERQFSDLKNIVSKIVIGGASGLKYEYTEQVSHISIILPLGEYRMILGTTKEYEDIFNQILASFKFLK